VPWDGSLRWSYEEAELSDKLVLHIEIADIGTDGWREMIESFAKDFGEDFDQNLYEDFLGTMARSAVHVVFCGVPGEKQMNHEFEVYVKPGRIIGARLAEVEG